MTKLIFLEPDLYRSELRQQVARYMRGEPLQNVVTDGY
jgi:hypothetical protein